MPVKPSLSEPELLLRELNHRVKNNFQVITSLMNVKKRHMAPEGREAIRFLEEHVLSMSVSFRLGYGGQHMLEISLSELITEVLSGLRQLGDLAEERLKIDTTGVNVAIDLDQAIALALYMATAAPPYLEAARDRRGGVVHVRLLQDAARVTLIIQGNTTEQPPPDVLRQRLVRGYAGQLQAKVLPTEEFAGQSIAFDLLA